MDELADLEDQPLSVGDWLAIDSAYQILRKTNPAAAQKIEQKGNPWLREMSEMTSRSDVMSNRVGGVLPSGIYVRPGTGAAERAQAKHAQYLEDNPQPWAADEEDYHTRKLGRKLTNVVYGNRDKTYEFEQTRDNSPERGI
jgi:hypothetical protein